MKAGLTRDSDAAMSMTFSSLMPWTSHKRMVPSPEAAKVWWRHQMEHFPRYWPFVRGNHRSPVNSPHKGQWRGALMFSLIRASINRWVNNREAGDLRRHRSHYYVIVLDKSVKSLATVILRYFNCKIALKWMTQDLTGDQSTVVHVMACRQATSHYLNQSWLYSMRH